MPTLLTPRLVDSSLAALTDWSGDTSGISRTIRLDSPAQVVDLIEQVEVSAQSLNHEPVVERSGTAVTFTLTTHEVGGVSEIDISLAARINNLAGRLVGAPPTPAPRTAVVDADEGARLAAGPGNNHVPAVVIDHAGETATGRTGLFKKKLRAPSVGVSTIGTDAQVRPGVAIPDDRPGHPEPGPEPEQSAPRR
ncbi:MAG TPA: 4a-hydroxytetrahydrobiopterin dehydratase [Mycobacteriales bacterium]|nr:4a-hydroxytetrahydrobiopterin dehydratase [Mycobacteriales bacterium]